MAISIIKGWLDAIAALFARNWLTILGAICATIGSLLIIAFFVQEWLAGEISAFAALFGFMILPAIFLLGLLLIPAGAWWDRRRRRKAREEGRPEPKAYPILDLNSPRTRRAVAIVAFLTVVNVFIFSTITIRGVQYSESVEFCGMMCHNIMEPQYAAFLDSPHSQVQCVKCHTRPGMIGFVEQKIGGLREVRGQLTGDYPQPLPAPVPHLPEAAETCEQCHDREMDRGDQLRITHSFQPDESNTQLTSVLLMHLGEGSENPGIHGWHNHPDRVVEYYARDEERKDIPYVRVTEPDGSVNEYFAAGEELEPGDIEPEQLRRMDCTDCHNRTGHDFLLPDQAVNKALAGRRISPELPSIRARGADILEAAAEEADGPAFIASEVRAFYEEEHPDMYAEREDLVEQAIAELQGIFNRNVFPGMKVTWGTYPNHIGHTTAEGCYRCHTNTHRTRGEDRLTISQDCTICHGVLAWDEHEPEIIQQLGLR